MARKRFQLTPEEYLELGRARIAMKANNTEQTYDALGVVWANIAKRIGTTVDSIELIEGEPSYNITAEVPDDPPQTPTAP